MERLPGRVDDRERDPARAELVAHGLAQVGEHGDDAHRPAGQRALDPALAGPATALHLGQDDGQLVAPGDPLDAAHDLQRPLALELVEDELQQLRPTRGADRPLVVVPADDRLDPATGARRHVRPPVEDLRDRRRGDARLARDHGEGRPVAASPAFRRRHARECSAASDRKFRPNLRRGIRDGDGSGVDATVDRAPRVARPKRASDISQLSCGGATTDDDVPTTGRPGGDRDIRVCGLFKRRLGVERAVDAPRRAHPRAPRAWRRPRPPASR